jgi:sugar (Glycoside-Pentoside-Hexuronide) transporter
LKDSGATIEKPRGKSATEHPQTVGFGEKVAYGCGDAANNIVWSSIATFMVFFLTDVAGIPAAVAGIIMLFARLFDGVVDIVVGLMVDRTHTRFGKSRPWLLWMCLPFGVLTVLLFSVPNLDTAGKTVYFAVVYTLINIVYSCINIPYSTLNTMITQDQYQRSLLNIYRMVGAALMSLVVSAGTAGFVKSLGNGPDAWQKVFTGYAILSIILFLITFGFTKERVKAPPSAGGNSAGVSVRKQISALLKNKYLWIIISMMFMLYIYNGLAGSSIYYCKYILGKEDLLGVIQVAGTLPAMVMVFAVAPLVKKYGKRNCALAGTVVSVIGNILMAANSDNFPMVLTGLVIRGIGMTPLACTGFAMVYDTIEYGDWKTGIRSEGLICSVSGLTSKVGTGLGAALIGWLLTSGGYSAGSAAQTAGSLLAIKAGFIYLPMVFSLFSIIALFFYKLDQLYPKIIKELGERAQPAIVK